ncbi:rifin PIR protein, putative [Plasmodium reichenowi]|uniref:Rifin PIR protein, putative n=1 Tax=Plasmodium reichenowi TaxID=5854 RepID=A0A2P9DTY7_PLARE|nr:rifin PIR protein, putative [Plasmodium reichenowi]
MNVHYIKILLFSLPLNILVHNQRNHESTTPHHTPKIPTTRLLCECEMYAPANYDDDPQMKEVMENFNKQTQERFHEYDERMKTARQKCKDQCDKEIQKIILKDKLEKELMDKFATLQTDIQNDAIPTCVCEKSMADKMEKGCLKCGGVLGGGVAPSVGLLGGLGTYAWKPAAIAAAKEAAKEAAIAAGKAAGDAYGKSAVIKALDYYEVDYFFPRIFESIRNIKNYTDVTNFSSQIVAEYKQICASSSIYGDEWIHFNGSFGLWDPETSGLIGNPSTEIPKTINSLVGTTKTAVDIEAGEVTLSKTPVFKETYMGAVESTYTSCQTAITASVIAIVVIILVMVIIYLVLRHRRKKKMKKKLQYIKLLEE